MAYTASALSFMLQNVNKPIILTGSQLPIGVIRTDGKENLITAIEIASDYRNNKPMVSEVAVYFEYQLYRGCRTHKYNTEHFDAFESPNYPVLAEAGVTIHYNTPFLKKPTESSLSIHKKLNTNIAILHLFPGINKHFIDAVFNTNDLQGLVLVSYGSGNAPNDSNLSAALKFADEKEIIVMNITQCNQGSVSPKRYATNKNLVKYGVNGKDLTVEAAVTKLMHVLAYESDFVLRKKLLAKPIAGEMSV